MKVAAQLVSRLNLEEVFKAAENNDPRVQGFAEQLDKLSGFDTNTEMQQASVQSERPFFPQHVYTVFSAYQGVMIDSVLILKLPVLWRKRHRYARQ